MKVGIAKPCPVNTPSPTETFMPHVSNTISGLGKVVTLRALCLWLFAAGPQLQISACTDASESDTQAVLYDTQDATDSGDGVGLPREWPDDAGVPAEPTDD